VTSGDYEFMAASWRLNLYEKSGVLQSGSAASSIRGIGQPMDRLKLCEALDVPAGGAFWVKELRLLRWGNEVVFVCVYELDTAERTTPFHIILEDCRELQWRVYVHLKHPEDATLPATGMVNIQLGSGDHRKAMHILTDSFGLSVSYGTLRIQRDG
jgi:hypothetical protein